jgi:hypothetical protein
MTPNFSMGAIFLGLPGPKPQEYWNLVVIGAKSVCSACSYFLSLTVVLGGFSYLVSLKS